MLVLHIDDLVIVSLDPFFANILASGNQTVETIGKVYQLIVSVEHLFRPEWGWPGTSVCITSVGARANVGAASRGSS